MNWKETKLHGNPPLDGDYLVAETSNDGYTYNVYQYEWVTEIWYCDNVSTDDPVAWMEFDPYEKLFIQKFH